MFLDKGIGGNEVPTEVNETIFEIPQNRTLLAQKLTASDPVKPELIEGLDTIEKVFEHFKPEIKIDFEDTNGVSKIESLKFSNLGDFGIKGITKQSGFLSELEIEKNQYQQIIKQLRTNKILQAAIENPIARKALYETILSLIQELENNKQI
ncbi:hypothetical protein [Elizabethkingia anophelis]|uniref:hypothetical protein n=1 Tax=Elizabethkingia anophelis TaxID=1117645 RepID=UPI0013718BC8|nr:hypothetical protein [Elizabethkingia anophelis]MYY27266.1 hypothetical protein [Elizabethkingia anophelis]